MALDVHTHTVNFDGAPAIGDVLSSHGSSLIIANSDLLTSTVDNDDPWAIVAEDDATASNCRMISTAQSYIYANIYGIWTQDAPLGNTPTVRVYGKVPHWNGSVDDREWPEDTDDTNFETVGANDEGFWIPLVDPDAPTSGLIEIDATISCAYTRNGASPDFDVGLAKTVYLAGCSHILVAVVTQATGPTAAMVGVRLVG
jgi:hypothetical protein